MRILLVALMLASSSSAAVAQRWQDATADCIGTTAQWTNKVEVADVDGDGLVDILFANGGDYDSPGQPEASRVWKNTGNWGVAGSHCTEISAQALGGVTGLSRVIKVADVDGDGDLDILFGGAYQSQLRLFLRNPTGWTDGSAQLPQQLTSISDIEFGDVDGDGDLDLLIADWGATNPTPGSAGGRTRLYLNNGTGTFTDATTTNMPDILVKMSWDVELVDVDNDWDLDALVSCKYCTRQLLFRNDGNGVFTDDPTALPQSSNNYEFEAMDIDGDGDLDLATINNGGNLKDTLLLNDGTGKFTDVSAQLGANPQADDNIAVWLDVDSDGDADLFIGSLGTDRLLLNDGAGNFTATVNVTPNTGPGATAFTLGVAAADLDGDGRLDLVQGQGEGADDSDKIQLASSMVAVDTSPPVVRFEIIGGKVFARVHDHQSPSRLHDWQRVFAETASGDVELTWYGEYLWSATASSVTRVCGIDRAGNMGCADMPSSGDGTPGGDAGMPPIDQSSGCCDANTRPSATVLPFLLAFVLLLRRRRYRGQQS
jgi:hypothetical protein